MTCLLNRTKSVLLLMVFCSLFFSLTGTHSVYAKCSESVSRPDESMEELEEVEWLIKHPPSGIIFTIREYDDEAFSWVAVRLNYYIYKLRGAHPKLSIAVLAHGDEVGSLSKASTKKYLKLHHLIQSWNKQDVITHACGSMAHMLGLDESSFPGYIDVVPYGPSQVKDYVELGYEHIELELTW
ncbi:MAG: DsrE family protein [Thiotrichaceae bacterium]